MIRWYAFINSRCFGLTTRQSRKEEEARWRQHWLAIHYISRIQMSNSARQQNIDDEKSLLDHYVLCACNTPLSASFQVHLLFWSCFNPLSDQQWSSMLTLRHGSFPVAISFQSSRTSHTPQMARILADALRYSARNLSRHLEYVPKLLRNSWTRLIRLWWGRSLAFAFWWFCRVWKRQRESKLWQFRQTAAQKFQSRKYLFKYLLKSLNLVLCFFSIL